MEKALQAELISRHLAHKDADGRTKHPLIQKTHLSDIKDENYHTASVSQTVETVYDDFSMDKMKFTTEADKIVESTISFEPDEDGILKSFINRYTTMLIKDSIYMEQHPAPQFMH